MADLAASDVHAVMAQQRVDRGPAAAECHERIHRRPAAAHGQYFVEEARAEARIERAAGFFKGG